jgi:hypothetical protein
MVMAKIIGSDTAHSLALDPVLSQDDIDYLIHGDRDPQNKMSDMIGPGIPELFHGNKERNERLEEETMKALLDKGYVRATDPQGKNQHQPGAKLDAGKPRPWLVLGEFRNALKEVVAVGTYGADKYSDNGWLEVPSGQQRYMDAAFRHLLAGEVRDPESDLPHLAMAAWNILAVLELRARGLG